LNAILEDLLQSFEKPKEDISVLTPRMLTDIAELKENISSLTEKSNDLEKELHKVKEEKAELVKIYDDQVINLEFQCSEAQLEVTTLENKIYDL
jgi:chromosome segregation ATPase